MENSILRTFTFSSIFDPDRPLAHFSLGPPWPRPSWGPGQPLASLEPQKLNTSQLKCKSSFIFAILLCVFEGRCHQVLYFARKSACRQRHGLLQGFKAPLATPLEPLSASTVWGNMQLEVGTPCTKDDSSLRVCISPTCCIAVIHFG